MDSFATRQILSAFDRVQDRWGGKQNGAMLLKKSLQYSYARQLGWRSLGLGPVVLEVDQPLAHQSDFQIRVVHLPDLTALEWWEEGSALSCFVLHGIIVFPLQREETLRGPAFWN